MAIGFYEGDDGLLQFVEGLHGFLLHEICESLDIKCVTKCVTLWCARNSFISALAHHGVMTAYVDYAVGHATSEVSALLAGYISNVTPAMMQPFNEKIFIVPST